MHRQRAKKGHACLLSDEALVITTTKVAVWLQILCRMQKTHNVAVKKIPILDDLPNKLEHVYTSARISDLAGQNSV